jgi:hypothetical protein
MLKEDDEKNSVKWVHAPCQYENGHGICHEPEMSLWFSLVVIVHIPCAPFQHIHTLLSDS